jgi:hypothetical protein
MIPLELFIAHSCRSAHVEIVRPSTDPDILGRLRNLPVRLLCNDG